MSKFTGTDSKAVTETVTPKEAIFTATDSDISVIKFEGITVSVVNIYGEPWFIAKDICDALALTNSRMALLAFDDDERNTVTLTYGIRGNPNHGIVAESGFYKLIARSRKASTAGTFAHRFSNWVFREVIPSIRKTGAYRIPLTGWTMAPAAMGAALAATTPLIASIAASSAAMTAGAGFMAGGYTGNMATNAVAGVVHGKEFVLNAAATKAIGVPRLTALNNAKPLDATLGKSGFGIGAQNVSNSSQKMVNNFNPNVNVSNSFTGKPDDATLMAINQSNQQLAKQIKAELASEIVTPQGQFGNALKSRYGRRGPQ